MMAVFITVVSLFLVASTYGQELQIEPSVSELLVREGSPHSMLCSTKIIGHIEWDYPMKGKTYDVESRLETNKDTKTKVSTLNFSNFTKELEGDYTCSVENNNQKLYEETITLVAVNEIKTEPFYYYGNKTAELGCQIGVSGRTVESVSWLKGGKPVADVDERYINQPENHTLLIQNPQRNDVGVYTAQIKLQGIDLPYKCDVEYKEFATSKETSMKTESMLQVSANKVEPTYHEDNDTAILSCSINVDSKTITSVEWLKNDTLVSKLKEKERFKVLENKSLLIKDVLREDADLYIARFHLVGEQNPFDCEVMFKAGPRVLKFKKSKNLMEKDNLELQCHVLGYPRADVFWYKDGKPLNVSSDVDSRVHLHSLNGYRSARLVIKDVVFDDAAEYSCEAVSVFFNESSSQTITVRVKDKLAALWPFLGIVFEVIVLCAIIFLYEKRRNKLAEQEERNSHEAEPALEKKDGLRHRNAAGNPTA